MSVRGGMCSPSYLDIITYDVFAFVRVGLPQDQHPYTDKLEELKPHILCDAPHHAFLLRTAVNLPHRLIHRLDDAAVDAVSG